MAGLSLDIQIQNLEKLNEVKKKIAEVKDLAALTPWFRRTEEGQNALSVATASFSQVFNSVLDIVDKIEEWLCKAFTKPKDALIDLTQFISDQFTNRMTAVKSMGESIWKILQGDFKGGFAGWLIPFITLVLTAYNLIQTYILLPESLDWFLLS